MPDTIPLYNSRITKIYLEYLQENHPDLDIDSVLEYAGISKYEVEDQAHWLSQKQVDRFNEIIIKETGDLKLPRKAGLHGTSTKELGAVKQYLIGLLNPTTIYHIMEKIYPLFSRGASIKAKRLAPNKIEIISTPKPNVNEKPYQCEMRIGMLQSGPKYFTEKFAHIEHPECYHEGHDCCRYILTWERLPSATSKQIRNYFFLAGILVFPWLFFVLQPVSFGLLVCFFGIIILSFTSYTAHLEKKELTNSLEDRGNAAKDLLDEMKIRHDNALLVQEIGTTISSVLDVDELLDTVANVMEMYVDFDRTIILLSNENKTRLQYAAGYGYGERQDAIMKNMEFNLDNPNSKGIFVLAFREKKPFLENDIAQIEKNFRQEA